MISFSLHRLSRQGPDTTSIAVAQASTVAQGSSVIAVTRFRIGRIGRRLVINRDYAQNPPKTRRRGEQTAQTCDMAWVRKLSSLPSERALFVSMNCLVELAQRHHSLKSATCGSTPTLSASAMTFVMNPQLEWRVYISKVGHPSGDLTPKSRHQRPIVPVCSSGYTPADSLGGE
ncbi:hypothetical protein SBA2_890018 [Acidobacteriia bacterium SbA2]|nr:hypothetical protein SBA2_890018 [Acidobacteriia bacterium SbA2]